MVQDICDVAGHTAHKVWRVHQENRGQVVDATRYGLEDCCEVQTGLKSGEQGENMKKIGFHWDIFIFNLPQSNFVSPHVSYVNKYIKYLCLYVLQQFHVQLR